MKKRFLLSAIALLTCISMLIGCTAQQPDDTGDSGASNEELMQMINDLSNEIAELRDLLTLPAGSLTNEGTAISDDEALELDSLFIAQEDALLAADDGSGTQVKERDWSKYTSDTAKAKLSSAEATLYDRLDSICRMYISNPNHVVLKGDFHYISSNTAGYSDLGLTKEEANKVFWWFKYNNPQYYFLQSYASTSTDLYATIYDFVVEQSDQAQVINEMFDKLDSWIEECSDDEVTDWDKITSANRLICESIIYSPDVKAKVPGASGGKNQTIYSVLMTDDTVCSGYAQTFTAMANAMGLDVVTVISPTHAWNAAKFGDGKYYFVDVCWNDDDSNNSYNESFIAVGTDYATYRDKGTGAHIFNEYTTKYSPGIPADNYENPAEAGALSAPSLRVSGSGSTVVKVEWDEVSGAEKYEYSVSNGSVTYASGSTDKTCLYAVIPGGGSSAKITVRATVSKNGRAVSSPASEITASASSSGSKQNKPSNVKVDHPEGVRITWDSDSSVDAWLVILHGPDSTCTRFWTSAVVEKGYIGTRWGSSWKPEGYTYMTVVTVKRSGDTETYSDPVMLKYSINDGMKLLSAPESSATVTTTTTAATTTTTAATTTSSSAGSTPANGNVTVEYTTGTYKGNMVNGVRDGYGVFTYNSGMVYEGSWKDGKYDGQGKLTWADGGYCEGEFKENKFVSGKRVAYLSNGTYTYESKNFENYKMNGQSTYTVEFDNGDKSVTSGVAKGGVISGNVVYDYTFASGGSYHYEGEYSNGKRNGYGVMDNISSSGNTDHYEGEFKDSQYNGQGVYDYTFASGGSFHYEGEFSNGKRNGYGVMDNISSGGNTDHYEGQFKDSQYSGQGVQEYHFSGGDYYIHEGSFAEGKAAGQGVRTYYYKSGNYFVDEGEFDGSLYNGTRTYYNASGAVTSAKTYVNGAES